MRTLILVVILSMVSQMTVGQKNFEGKITYIKFDKTSESDTTVVYFGKKKIKIKNEIFDFITGNMYTFSPGDSNYLQEPLKDFILNSNSQKISPVNIKKKKSGFSCSAYEEQNDRGNNIWKNLQILHWYADSLYYFIPLKFENCVPISKYVNNGKIIAGTDVISRIDSTVIVASEVLIVRQQIPNSIFQLPSGYNMKWRSIPNKPAKKRIRIGGTKQENN